MLAVLPDTANVWNALGTWALVLVGILAAMAAVATYRKIGAQTRIMGAQTQAIEHQVRTMREQWEDEHVVRLDFVPVVGPDLSIGGSNFGGIGFRVWNFGRHALRIVGFEFLEPGGRGAVWPRDLLLRSEDADTLVITEPFVRLFSAGAPGAAPDLDLIARLRGDRFRAAVHYRGIAGAGTSEFEFFVTYLDGALTHRFTVTVAVPPAAPTRALAEGAS